MFVMLLMTCSLVAQTRIVADPSMRDLSSSNRRFTRHEKHRQADSRGLRRSKETAETHMLGLYGLGGFSSAVSSSNLLRVPTGGYDARMGFVYEYNKGFFMLQTGVAGALREVRADVNNVVYTNHDLVTTDAQWMLISDSWGMPLASLSYSMTDRRDNLLQLSAQIPIMAGAHIRGFYAMGGFTFTFPLIQNSSTAMNVTSRATYDRYYGIGDNNEWMEMDNHGYREAVPMKRTMNNSGKRLDVLFCVETGYDFLTKNDIHLRLGAYADIGLLNFSPHSDNPAINIPYSTKWDFATFGATPIWFSDVVKNEQIHNFTVGGKLTILFSFKQKEQCILCGSKVKTKHFR